MFVIDPVVVRNLFFNRVDQRLFQEVACRLDDGRKRITAYSSGRYARGEQISGSGIAAANVRKRKERESFRINQQIAHLCYSVSVLKPDSGDDYMLWPLFAEFCPNVPIICISSSGESCDISDW